LNLWARLPDDTDLAQLSHDCEHAGVIIAGGTEWFPAEPTGPYIRLNYSGPNPASFLDGARILGATLGRRHG
jgi:DNA-binding transcriptional MocR family regulator